MLVINPMRNDTRVDKEAASLTAAGLSVTVVSTWEPGLERREIRDGFHIHRVPYRRAVKDVVVGRQRAARRELAGRRAVVQRLQGLPGSRPFLLRVALWLHVAVLVARRLLGRGRWLFGGGLLKIARSRILVTEYWRSIAAGLPGQLPRPQVIHAHDLGTLAAAVRLADAWQRHQPGSSRPRVVYDSHELYVEQQTRWKRWEKWLWRAHETRWIRRADAVITVSEGIADELRRRYRLRRRPVVLLNAPDASADGTFAADLRSDLQLGDTTPLVVYVGTAKAGRGVDQVVEAMTGTSWHLALVGAGTSTHVDELQQRAKALGAGHRLHVVPAVPAPQLSTYIRSADLGIHPLLPSCLNHELAMPNKLFDYLAAGLPVAVSALQEMGRFVTATGCGVVFHADDPADIATAVARILDGGRDRSRPGSALTWDAQEQGLFRTYAELTGPLPAQTQLRRPLEPAWEGPHP